jgi:hypothetical protein
MLTQAYRFSESQRGTPRSLAAFSTIMDTEFALEWVNGGEFFQLGRIGAVGPPPHDVHLHRATTARR